MTIAITEEGVLGVSKPVVRETGRIFAPAGATSLGIEEDGRVIFGVALPPDNGWLFTFYPLEQQ